MSRLSDGVKMKKSSLGRRSSLLGQGRLSNVDKSTLRNQVEGRKSFIPKPSFGSRNDRSSSVDREGVGSSVKKDPYPSSGLRRSRSFHDLNRLSTPCQTPTQFARRNTNILGSQKKFSDGGRSSSIGGPKSARKESRPINEKSFQVDAQQKIQSFFLERRPELLDKGSIKPMTSAMFSNLVSYLLRPHDKSIVVTRANLIEEVSHICKLFSYRGKAEKSWLLTVNAPHSWPYVVSFLLWLVELYLASEAVKLEELLYPERVEDEAEEVDDINFKLLVPHLLKGYKTPNDCQEMQQFLVEYSNMDISTSFFKQEAIGLDDKEQEGLQKEYRDLQTELNDSEDAQEEEKLEDLKISVHSLRNDIKNTQDFIYDAETFVSNGIEKRREKDASFQELRIRKQHLEEEKNKLRILVSSQEVTPDHKQEMEDHIATLRREIRQLNEEINDYQDEVYKEDIELVKASDEFKKSIQSYNKAITVNRVNLPILNSVQIENSNIKHMDAPNAEKRFEEVDLNLKQLKTSEKNKMRDLEMEVQKEYSNLQKMEDKLTLLSEEKDRSSIQCDQLENEIAQMKQTLAKEKDETKALLNEIQQNIKKEKENEFRKINEDEELVSVVKIFAKRKSEVDGYVIKGLAQLDEKVESNSQFEFKLAEITKRIMAETKKKIEDLNKE